MNNQNKERKIGFVGIIVYDRDAVHQKLNQILHDYSSIIIGRMGLPYREGNLSIISLIVDGSGDEIGTMTGKIGQLPGVTVRAEFVKLN